MKRLPRMLAQIESEIANAGPGEKRRLQRRAELIRELLAPILQPLVLIELAT